MKELLIPLIGATFLCSSVLGAASFQNYLTSDNFINEINSKAKTWTAGQNFHPETSTNYIKGLLGLHPDHKKYLPAKKTALLGESKFPTYFFLTTGVTSVTAAPIELIC